MEFKNEVLEGIWKDRYQKNNESISQNLERVADFCGNNKIEKKEFYDVMEKGYFYPAGRTMSNSGIGRDLTLNNCFVAPQIKDDLSDIFSKVSLGARTHQKGGGIGYDFSNLRPNGSPTSNDAVASGAISFMDVFNAQTSTILQGNRRGANMGVLNVYNMDIEEFITAKSYEEGKLNHFNISVMVDNDFITAVRNEEKIFLHYPVYDDSGKIENDESKWKYKKEIDAKKLWDSIIHRAYDNGEPGIFFYDNLNKDNNLWYIEKIVCSNPCFTGDMRLLTKDGYKTFEELDGLEVEIVNSDGDISKSNIWCSGEKETVQVRLSDNRIIKCTPDHRFMTIEGEECKAIDLKGKKIFPILKTKKELDQKYIKLGFIQGDGQLTRLNSKYHKGIDVNIGKNDSDIYELFKDDSFTIESDRKIYLSGYNEDLEKMGFSKETLPLRKFPLGYSSFSNIQKRSFIQGCYSANGSIIKDNRVSYKTTCLDFANKLSEVLLNDFNIKSYITTNKERLNKFKNGEYKCKESYDVNISSYESIITFMIEINFYQKYKKLKLENLLRNRTLKVTSIKPNGIQKVYDFTEPLTHWGVVEGCVVHNCGEYVAGTVFGNDPNTHKKLDSNDFGGACNLGSLFLHNFVKNPFTKEATIDYDNLKKSIYVGVKFLDNIIDINKFPDKIYENYQKNFRTIGLGITGLADMLAMLNLKYNSSEAQFFVNDLMNYISLNIYKSSIELAKDKGSFPFLDKEKFVKSGFIKKHCDGEFNQDWKNVKNDILKYGIRNAKLISIAPTGTLSLTFGNNCSSGLEPIFSLEYERKVKIGGQSDDNISIVKMQDYAYGEWLKIKDSKDNIVQKDKFITALEMKVEDHIDMLGIIAYHVDMSCSKTINVPSEYSFEQTKNIYMRCYDLGIKGCTIFRPNEIRQGIMITEKTKEEIKDNSNKELPRGFIIKADDNSVGRKRTLKTGCGTLHCEAFFDSISGELLETYFSKGSSGGCNNFMIGLSRMISLSARGGVDIYTIVDQLKSSGTCPSYAVRRATKGDTSIGSSCPVAIGNALIDMYKEVRDEIGFEEEDGEKMLEEIYKDNNPSPIKKKLIKKQISNPCPQCGEELSFEGGCNICKSCGWSKCD